MNRRDLLKLFGVGAAAVPLIGGVPEMAGAATIIAPPQVELYKEVPCGMDKIVAVSRERVFVSVDITVKRTGEHVRFLADSFVLEVNQNFTGDVNQYGTLSATTASGMLPTIDWTMRGIAVEGQPRFTRFSRDAVR